MLWFALLIVTPVSGTRRLTVVNVTLRMTRLIRLRAQLLNRAKVPRVPVAQPSTLLPVATTGPPLLKIIPLPSTRDFFKNTRHFPYTSTTPYGTLPAKWTNATPPIHPWNSYRKCA